MRPNYNPAKTDLFDVLAWIILASVCGISGLPWGLTFTQGASLFAFGFVFIWLVSQVRGK